VAQDLVEQGLAKSLAQPGGNLTGMDSRSFELTSKRLELLKDALPHLTRVAILVNPAFRVHARIPGAFEAEARALGLHLLRVEAGDPEAFEAAFATMVEHQTEALVIMDNSMFAQSARRLAELALVHRLPTMAATRRYAETGSLIVYGANVPDLCRRSAVHVDKILKGARPATLPVERAYQFDFIVNLKTAEALGLTLSPQFLFLANEIIR
jgi:putative ABC transport system substrate-binding protein